MPAPLAHLTSFATGLRVSAAVLLLVAAGLVPVGRSPSGAHAAVKPPNDPLFTYQWHLRAIQIPRAWAVSRGAGATVAVLDTGVAYEDRGIYRRAPDLAGTRFVPGWDFVDGDAHPDDEALPGRQSHGTHIAGSIAETTNNGIGGAGVAPRAAIMPVRVLKPDLSGSGRTIARGLRFAADHGANVANLSIAGPSGAPALEQAIDYAWSKGVTVVASAGNDGRSSVSFPAAYPKVLAVGAVSRDETLAYYSNHGKALDLVAPGGDTGGESGDGVLQQTLKGGPSTFCYCFMASTSAAAAQVSGAAALLVASGRATTPAEVRAALLSSARDLGPRGRDADYGAGLVQAASALAGADGSSSRHSTPAGPRFSGPSWLAWLALTAALASLGRLVGPSLVRRRRRAHER
jgi:serine protease